MALVILTGSGGRDRWHCLLFEGGFLPRRYLRRSHEGDITATLAVRVILRLDARRAVSGQGVNFVDLARR